MGSARCKKRRLTLPSRGRRPASRSPPLMSHVGLHSEENEMIPERNPLSVHRNFHPANSVATMSRPAVFIAASWSAHRSAVASPAAASSKLSQGVSFRAQLRSSSSEFRSCRFPVASSLAVQRSGAVRSVSTSCASRSTSLRSTSLPNNALVPTANRHAPVGSRSQSAAPAAQRGRVCRAWHETRGVKVFSPGSRRAEG